MPYRDIVGRFMSCGVSFVAAGLTALLTYALISAKVIASGHGASIILAVIFIGLGILAVYFLVSGLLSSVYELRLIENTLEDRDIKIIRI